MSSQQRLSTSGGCGAGVPVPERWTLADWKGQKWPAGQGQPHTQAHHLPREHTHTPVLPQGTESRAGPVPRNPRPGPGRGVWPGARRGHPRAGGAQALGVRGRWRPRAHLTLQPAQGARSQEPALGSPSRPGLCAQLQEAPPD